MTDAQFIAWLKKASSIRTALVEVVARIGGVETTLYLSNRPYVTGAADAPANTRYDPCIVGGVSFTETLNLDGDPSISYGDIEIGNQGGVRDGWLDYVWANRQIKVYMGDPRWIRSDFRKVFDGIVGDIDSRTAEVLNLRLLDKLQRLNNPVTEATLGGATNNKDRLIPFSLGECSNVQPLLIDPATLKYQVHGGAIEDVIEARDNGAPVSITKQIAAGTFTLNQLPAGTITASVQGDKPAAYHNDISNLVQRLATGYGPATTRFSGADLDAANLAAFAAANTQPVGLYGSDRVNVLAACQQLAASVGAYAVVTTLGLLRLVQVALPPPGVATVVTEVDLDYHTLHVAERRPVVSTCKLAWCKNWMVQESGLAGGLPPTSAVLFNQEWLTTTSSDAGVAAIYKLDAEPQQQETLLLVEADAVAEAARRRDLWKTPRTIYEAQYRAHLLLTELGDAITIKHARFGLAAGKTGMVVNIVRNWLAGRVTLGVLI
jgi:hypothetical protein